jgi:hypothetical protein
LTLFAGIELTPLLSMIGVILRSIYIGIELRASIELELLNTITMAVRVTIEAFDYTAQSDIRAVGDGAAWEDALFGEQLSECLESVVQADGVCPYEDGLLAIKLKVVALLLVGDL